MNYGLSDKVIESIQNVFESCAAIDKVILFGSRAKGNYKEGSDIDLAVKGRDYTFDTDSKVRMQLDDLNLPYKIDLINYHTIKEPALIEHIDRVGIELYSRWKKFQLGDLIEVKHGFAFKGSNITDEPTQNILVTPGNFYIGGGFKNSKFKYYNSDFPEDYVLKEGDVVVTMTDLSVGTDTLGYSAKVPKQNGVKFLHNQRIGLVNFISKSADKDFIYWVMRTKEYQGFIVGSASGTSIMHTAPSRIKEYGFLLPPLPEQKSIASTLSSLDDKIDLLHRQNKCLEQLAETLFRQWFVEEAGNWENGKIGDVLELIYGKTLKEEIRTGKGFPVVGSSGIVGYHSEYLVEAPGIVIGRKGTLGKVIYLFENFYPIDTTYFVKSKNKSIGLYYEYFLLKTMNFLEMNFDSAVPGLNRDIALSSEIKIPSEKTISEFNAYCTSLFQKIKSNTNQIRNLTQLRDTLLPKLMNGEVKVEMN